MSFAHHSEGVEMNETTSLLKKTTNTDSAPNKRSNSFVYAIALTTVAGVLFFMVASSIPKEEPSDLLGAPKSPADDLKSINLDIDRLALHVTIVYDKETGFTKLVDNAPIMCRPSSISSYVTCPDGATSDLATADYQLNVGGNGWNYISIDSVDMRQQVIKGPKHTEQMTPTADRHRRRKGDEPVGAPQEHIEVGELIDRLQKNGDLGPVRQQYIRQMHAVGLLEGYLSCREIGYWYANFYDGLFEGGTVNRATMEFLEQNHVWMNQQAALYWEVDDYWLTVRGLMSQLEGLLIGAQNGCPGVPEDEGTDDAHSVSDYKGVFMPSMEHGVAMQHLLLMNANGDMFQIMQKYPANLVNNTRLTNRHGDTGIDSTPVVDDYVDDYTIAKAHNITNTPTEDDDDPYAADTDGDNNRRLDTTVEVPGTKITSLPEFPTDLTPAQIMALPNLGSDHCSALIKLLPDLSDVVFGHDTWDEYQTAYPRVFKHVRYNRMKDSAPIHGDMMDIYFSASPGLLASIDDFYVIHGQVANLAVTETSLDMYNAALVDLINPTTMLCWARTVVSNRLSTSGNSWVENFSRYHSGTYANQWMVLDFNKFVPYQQPRAGFLTVLEELPGIMHHEDVTQILVGKGYWASYNNPYFKEIQVLSGCSAKCMVDTSYCHFSAPRAKIFRVHQETVRSVSDLQALMQYNKYATDPFSKDDSCKAIACRKDLEPNIARRAPFGAIDSKVSSATLAGRHITPAASLRRSASSSTTAPRSNLNQPEIRVKLGPTNEGNTPFCWSAVGPTTGDITVTAVPVEPATPADPTSTPVDGPASGDASGEASGEATGSVKATTKVGAPETAHLRAAASQAQAETHRNALAADSADSVSSEETNKDASGESDEPENSAVDSTALPTPQPSALPTAAPTFLQGPRVYVHMGHPECFDFDWETMPPLAKEKKH